MFIPFDNTVQIEMIYNWDGQVVENVLQYHSGLVGILESEAIELCAFLVDWWDTNWQNSLPTTVTLQQLKYTDLSSATGYAGVYTTGLPLTGSNASPSLPNNCSIALTKRTASRGRSYRGRIYFVGLSEVMVTGNNVVSGTLSDMLTKYNNIVNITIEEDDYTMVVCSRYEDGVPRVTGVATPVTNITSDGVIDSQRRRLPGRGA